MKKFLLLVVAVILTMAFATSAFSKPKAGMILIRDEPQYWNVQFPEMLTMKVDAMKFHLSYDNQWNGGWPQYYVIPAVHVQGAIDAGAKTIIFRSPATKITPNEISHFIAGMRFWDTNERIVDFIYNRRYQGIEFWIEVGNEPDLHGADPWVHRYWLIETAKTVKPQWAWLWPMKWMASMPTKQGNAQYPGVNYSNVIYTNNSEGWVPNLYDGLGTHAYGFWTLYANDGNQPMWETFYALNNSPSTKPVFITEAMINNGSLSWNEKGIRCKSAFQSYAQSHPRIKGWFYFALSQEIYWNTNPLFYGIDLYNNTTNPIPERPFATQMSTR
ncbi:MAG: hypothetical protein SNJ70_01500 [Armatimonadota bacterium]